MKLKIKNVKPMKVGNSHYFLIPKQYITNDVINSMERYNIEIDKAKQ